MRIGLLWKQFSGNLYPRESFSQMAGSLQTSSMLRRPTQNAFWNYNS
jgi:hypothetical protein